MIGTTLRHYRITDKLGEGGMGVVYRAHDERLDRNVAVKVLHEAVAQDVDRLARFEREAKAVAKLDHPNILAIHDFGTDQGVTYAVTELLDGQNLRQSIPASGMPWQKVVEIGAAIADGLAAAHGKGIVHRDLKPDNVFITSDGRVKILDFGLAQVKMPVEEEAETATLTPAGTVAGTVLGTMGYMSPEQLRGEPSDARSDIFALGCVLYEMLSGQTAFLRNEHRRDHRSHPQGGAGAGVFNRHCSPCRRRAEHPSLPREEPGCALPVIGRPGVRLQVRLDRMIVVAGTRQTVGHRKAKRARTTIWVVAAVSAMVVFGVVVACNVLTGPVFDRVGCDRGGRSSDPLHRRAATRKSLRRSGAGILRRWS